MVPKAQNVLQLNTVCRLIYRNYSVFSKSLFLLLSLLYFFKVLVQKTYKPRFTLFQFLLSSPTTLRILVPICSLCPNTPKDRYRGFSRTRNAFLIFNTASKVLFYLRFLSKSVIVWELCKPVVQLELCSLL